MNPLHLRPAAPADAEAILAVYRPYVENTIISFELELPSSGAFRERVESTCRFYPYLVCEINGAIVAYAYAGKYRERPAYRFGAETSVYSAETVHGRGIGKALYTALLELLTVLGYRTAYAGIAVPNEKSFGLHEAFGFALTGTSLKAGYKLGRWIDVIWMEKPLSDYPEHPADPRPATELDSGFVREVLTRCESLIRWE